MVAFMGSGSIKGVDVGTRNRPWSARYATTAWADAIFLTSSKN